MSLIALSLKEKGICTAEDVGIGTPKLFRIWRSEAPTDASDGDVQMADVVRRSARGILVDIFGNGQAVELDTAALNSRGKAAKAVRVDCVEDTATGTKRSVVLLEFDAADERFGLFSLDGYRLKEEFVVSGAYPTLIDASFTAGPTALLHFEDGLRTVSRGLEGQWRVADTKLLINRLLGDDLLLAKMEGRDCLAELNDTRTLRALVKTFHTPPASEVRCACRCQAVDLAVGYLGGQVVLFSNGGPRMIFTNQGQMPIALAASFNLLVVLSDVGAQALHIHQSADEIESRVLTTVPTGDCCVLADAFRDTYLLSIRTDDVDGLSVLDKISIVQPEHEDPDSFQHLLSVQKQLTERLQAGMHLVSASAVAVERKEKLIRALLQSAPSNNLEESQISTLQPLQLDLDWKEELRCLVGGRDEPDVMPSEPPPHTGEEQALVVTEAGHSLRDGEFVVWAKLTVKRRLGEVHLCAYAAGITSKGTAHDLYPAEVPALLYATVGMPPRVRLALFAVGREPRFRRHLAWITLGDGTAPMPEVGEHTRHFSVVGDEILLRTGLQSLRDHVDLQVNPAGGNYSRISLSGRSSYLQLAVNQLLSIPNILAWEVQDPREAANVLSLLKSEHGPREEADTDQALATWLNRSKHLDGDRQ